MKKLTLIIILCFLNSISMSFGKTKKCISRYHHALELLGKRSYRRLRPQIKSKIFNVGLGLEIKKFLSKSDKHLAKRITKSIFLEAKNYNFDPVFITAVILGESSFNPKVVGGVGEIGLMQIRPQTGKWISELYSIKNYSKINLYKAEMNIKVGTAYLNHLRNQFVGKSSLYIAAYNMGAGNVKKILRKNKKPRIYPLHVMKRYFDIYKNLNLIHIRSIASLKKNKKRS